MRRLVDPVHFFDARGNSVLGYDRLAAENARLEAENEALRQRLTKLQARLQAYLGDSETAN